MRTRHLATLAAGILSIAIGGCSSSTDSNAGTGGKVNPPAGTGGQTPAGTGGSGTGGVVAGTGGATTGTGGATTGTGGATTGSGGKTTGAGGKTAGSGGSETGGRTGAGGATADGGSSGGGSSGRPDAGSMGGRGSGGATGPVGTGGSTTVVPPVDGGGSSGPSAGCQKTTAKPDRKTQQTMTIAGATRYYLLNVPSNADGKTPLPLVIACHGYNMNNYSLVDLYDFTAESGNKAITVLPEGEGDAPGNTSKWGSGIASTFSANDANYTFIQTLKTYIEDNYCVDTSRVYLTGFSMGGMFTNSLACDHNDWFRGYAPVEGGGPGTCAHADAKPAIIIHQGTADTIATPAKGGEPTRDFWTKQNGCNTTTTSAYTGCLSYGACEEPVLYCTGNWTHTVDRIARANIWKFFDTLK